MERPDFIFVTGCNAAGKSSLIRSHLSEFPGYEVIMTDVYKGRSREVFKQAIRETKNIILETPAQSLERVANRRASENGLYISPGNVEYNFIENFKNVAICFPYFDESYFLYTGEKGLNQLVMRFEKDRLVEYNANNLTYIQKFAEHAFQKQGLDKKDFGIIVANSDYFKDSQKAPPRKSFRT
jgi:hypothetical protein